MGCVWLVAFVVCFVGMVCLLSKMHCFILSFGFKTPILFGVLIFCVNLTFSGYLIFISEIILPVYLE